MRKTSVGYSQYNSNINVHSIDIRNEKEGTIPTSRKSSKRLECSVRRITKKIEKLTQEKNIYCYN